MKLKNIMLIIPLTAILVFSGVQGTRAVQVEKSEEMKVSVNTKKIGIELTSTESGENGGRTLKIGLETDKIGMKYPEKVTVKNTGSIDEYVRLVVTARWLDEEGNDISNNSLEPEFINFVFDDATMKDWAKQDACGKESRIYYYKGILSCEEGSNELVLTGESWIDTEILSYNQTETTFKDEGKTICTTTYIYHDVWCEITVEADAVQTHNAQDAVTAAWGNNAWKLING